MTQEICLIAVVEVATVFFYVAIIAVFYEKHLKSRSKAVPARYLRNLPTANKRNQLDLLKLSVADKNTRHVVRSTC